jgi:hypothetical protein
MIMNEQITILNKLLNKLHKSRPFVENTERTRGVILKCNKRDFPEYDYENSNIKMAYNEAAKNSRKAEYCYNRVC